MIPSSFVPSSFVLLHAWSLVLLHGGHGQEITLLEYLFRVVVYLGTFGVLAALVFWSSSAVEAVRSAFSASRGSEESES